MMLWCKGRITLIQSVELGDFHPHLAQCASCGVADGEGRSQDQQFLPTSHPFPDRRWLFEKQVINPLVQRQMNLIPSGIPSFRTGLNYFSNLSP